MKESPRRFATYAILAGVVLVSILAFVEYRSRSPEWKVYQQKGFALSVRHLEQRLRTVKDSKAREKILLDIAGLKTREPEIMEIRPFGGKMAPERCLTCHWGIEDLSASHPNSVFGCVSCHGGNGGALTVKSAHLGLRGGRNPARLDLAFVSCGSNRSGVGTCHSEREHPFLNRADNVPRSLMATNAGIINILRFQWGLEPDSRPRFGIKAVSDGQTALQPIPPEFDSQGRLNLADSHFRKFCASCHLWSAGPRQSMGRLQGCPACHAPYGKGGNYEGGDPTINRDETGHPKTHTITNLIPDERCRACHNRSARVGLSYHGQMESAQYGTPFVRGGLNDETISDSRHVLNLVPDIHHEKGLACIDCHTGQETMGDGKVYGHMEDQLEIRCEDCHGTHTTPPSTMVVKKDDHLVQALTRSSPFVKPPDGSIILKTSKGRPLTHVRRTEEGYVLTGKLTGKQHPVTVITGKSNAHRIKGHERLDCDSCHSAWSPQCYGCHQLLDLRFKGKDQLTNKKTRGRWVEGRGHFRFTRNIYGINSRGKVGILVPGCQVWNTVIDANGNVVTPYDSKIMQLRNGKTGIAMGPIHPHTTRTEAPRCVECHLDPKSLGLGEGRLRVDSTGTVHLEPIYDSSASGLKISFPIDAAVDTDGTMLQGTSHRLSRPFNKKEIGKILGIAPCLPCHDRYDDPAWDHGPPYTLRKPCREALQR
jgi:hypothetical protein